MSLLPRVLRCHELSRASRLSRMLSSRPKYNTCACLKARVLCRFQLTHWIVCIEQQVSLDSFRPGPEFPLSGAGTCPSYWVHTVLKGGTKETDRVFGATITEDGSVILSGTTAGMLLLSLLLLLLLLLLMLCCCLLA